MSDVGNFIDGRGLLTKSAFRSGYFIWASLAGLGCLLLTAYIIYRHWSAIGASGVVALISGIGIQVVYQWWRALRYYARLRKLYSNEEAREGSMADIALRVAAGAMVDLLFYSFGIVLFALGLMAFFFARLNRLR